MPCSRSRSRTRSTSPTPQCVPTPSGYPVVDEHAAEVPTGTPGVRAGIDYEPAESTTAMFGGNSNWRGPVWFPRILRRRAHDRIPDGFGQLGHPRRSRLRSLGTPGVDIPCRQRRIPAVLRWSGPVSDRPPLAEQPAIFDYFHGDNGAGLGASHQTGWTGLVADVIRRRHRAYPAVSQVIQRLVQVRRPDEPENSGDLPPSIGRHGRRRRCSRRARSPLRQRRRRRLGRGPAAAGLDSRQDGASATYVARQRMRPNGANTFQWSPVRAAVRSAVDGMLPARIRIVSD